LKFLHLLSILALSFSSLAAQTEEKSWSIRVAALDIAGTHDTLWLRTGPEKDPMQISLNTRVFSPPVEFKGPAALAFFKTEAEAKAAEPPAPLASTILKHESALILFSAKPDQKTYQTYTIADGDFPFGSFRLVNFSSATVRAEFSGKPVLLKPNAAETIPFREGQAAIPVRILAVAEGAEPRIIRQTSWSITPTQRELVLCFPNPANGLIRLRHFVDSKTE
jgi:hypothetical protein